MLIMLLPEQVMTYWDMIRESVENTLPPNIIRDEENLANIQIALYNNDAQCWMYVDEDEGKIVACLMTHIVYDDFSNSKSLEISTIFSFGKTKGEYYVDGFETIKKYAIGRGCKRVIAYSNHPVILAIVKKLGFGNSYTFTTYDLEGEYEDN